ncbi:MAG: lamin tail domain-containing protein, partial [Bacteroidales bacterium]|nr:lamin tail domain-containing protein [Bacteroidales bacterium]
NSTIIFDEFGEFEDWIEIYNPGNKDVDLAGYYLSDDPMKLDRWQVSAGDRDLTVVFSKYYLVLWADKDTSQGILHAPFGLSRNGEIIILSKLVNDEIVVIDSVRFGVIPKNSSYGRCSAFPSHWKILDDPTPGNSNDCPPVKRKRKSGKDIPHPEPSGYDNYPAEEFFFSTQDLVINELVARNAKGLKDEFGDDDDWIEIYNPGGTAVNIAGLYMSDTSDTNAFHRIPGSDASKTTIQAGGHLILWADGETTEGINHLPFKLSNGGEAVYLAEMIGGQLSIIDQIAFPKLERDVPYGRYPDGSDNWILLSDPSPGSANLPVRILGNVTINEIMAVNTGQDVDEYGEAEDWIEFYNKSANPVDLGGAYITDSIGELTMHRFPVYAPDSTTIPAGEALRFWVDSDPKQGILHIDFKLSRKGEKITLVQPDGHTIVQEAQYPASSSDASFGQYPDGSNNWIYLNIPTPKQMNQYTYTSVNGIVINEFIADNNILPDKFGEFEDWIEFYNTNDFTVDIGGLLVTDSLQNPLKFRIPGNAPDSTSIQAHGFLVFWADNNPEQGIMHLDVKLASSGESIGLAQYRNEAVYLDTHTFGQQTTNVSKGRFPDGTGNWMTMDVPTPGGANIPQSGNATGIYINEVMARNISTLADEFGNFVDWIEVYNDNNTAVDLGGFYFTDLLSSSEKSLVPVGQPEKTTVPAKGYLIFWPDANNGLGANHLNFQLAGAGEQVGLFQKIGSVTTVIDSLTYPVQTADVSYGRNGDGGSEWMYFTSPSPLSSNAGTGIDYLSMGRGIDLLIFPNPVENELFVKLNDNTAGYVEWKIVGLDGRELANGAFVSYRTGNKQSIGSLSALNLTGKGLYFLQITAQQATIMKRFIIR